jgi:hypothetical protein
MVDLNGPRGSLAVSLPVGLIEQLREIAARRRVSLDELIQEACLTYSEPVVWQHAYHEWLRDHQEANTRP